MSDLQSQGRRQQYPCIKKKDKLSLSESNVKQITSNKAQEKCTEEAIPSLAPMRVSSPLPVYTWECISPLSLPVHLDTYSTAGGCNHEGTLIPDVKMCPERVIALELL